MAVETSHHILKRQILERLLSKFELALIRAPLDLDFLEFVMYLGASTNNRASTAYGFFLEATQRHGVPLRVRGDQGVENVQRARFMFSVRGTDRGSFISGKSVHNQRIERLWRDVRVIVTNKYSAILLSLEEDGLLDISSTDDLFCVHYIILPRLQMDLGIFTEGWNHHPLSTERNQCPEQLWQLGLMQTNMDQPESPEEPDVDWEVAADHDGEEEDAGNVVPEFDCPLSPEDITELQSVFQQIDPNTPVKELYLLCREYVAERCGS
ncbi:ATP-dependent helicase/deoxyribonuclease subunit B [Dissostichus eleginoides]|uniref:ATP-dependent helicase/deoxyribonuclease subunit B n=1 Tax=Dissostichus eleginoides TaxID=100907 RepID=A0AAD9CKS1_DISEL|nr:ATP-dependent helicase/deoxyribonuclease subunit B [Dissostichus eleginoides]